MWRATFKTALFMGLLLGTLFGFEAAEMGGLLPYAKDTFLFVVVIAVFTALACIGLFSIMQILLRWLISERENSERQLLRINLTTGVFLIVWSQATFCFIECFRPVSFRSPLVISGIVVLAVCSLGLSILLISLFSKFTIRCRSGKKIAFSKILAIWVPVYLGTLLLVTIMVSVSIARTPLNKMTISDVDSGGRVLLLGLDAADWSALIPLIENGKLPNIKKLIEEGSSGNLTSLISRWGAMAGDSITFGIESPAIWNSIITGKSPSKHGIGSFVFTEIPLIENPFRYRLIPEFITYRERIENLLQLNIRPSNGFLRKCKAAWNILTDAGLRVSALGWWATWPAESVNGEILSDRLVNPDLLKKWYPAGLVSEEDMKNLTAQLEDFPPEDLRHYTQFPYDPAFEERYKQNSYEYNRNELVENFMSYLLLDKYRSRLGLKLLNQHKYALMAVYYYALDVAGHSFMRFKHPSLFLDIQWKDVDYFGEIIDKYYIWFDGELGKYLANIDNDSSIIICSDHGMGPWTEATSMKKGVHFSGSHRKQGVLIMWGNHIRQGMKIADASVLDILPTILYLVGLPVGRDMDGEVIEDAIEIEFLGASPIKEIDTYETEQYTYEFGQGTGSVNSGDPREIERLKSLGYLK